MNPLTIYWDTKMNIPGTGWTISGYSRSRFRTGFYIKELNIMLDAGPQLQKKPDHIFITHTHGDHIAELPFTMINGIGSKDKITVYCPTGTEEYLRQYIAALFNVNRQYNARSYIEKTYNLIPINQTRHTQRLIINKQKIDLDTVGADHSVETVIYGFSIIRDKLDPKYEKLPGREIGLLRKSGVTVTNEIVIKQFCYVLDTSIKILQNNKFLLEYPVIIIECTFFKEDEQELAIKKKHIHWIQLKPYVKANQKTTFILTHFSLRHKDKDIHNFFVQECRRESITNVVPWLTDKEL